VQAGRGHHGGCREQIERHVQRHAPAQQRRGKTELERDLGRHHQQVAGLAQRHCRVDDVARAGAAQHHQHRHHVERQRDGAQQPGRDRQRGEAARRGLQLQLRTIGENRRTLCAASALTSSNCVACWRSRSVSCTTQRGVRCKARVSGSADGIVGAHHAGQGLADVCLQCGVAAGGEFDATQGVDAPLRRDARRVRQRADRHRDEEGTDQREQDQQGEALALPLLVARRVVAALVPSGIEDAVRQIGGQAGPGRRTAPAGPSVARAGAAQGFGGAFVGHGLRPAL